jgi:sulfur transfer complex TusBCD TusB component (DsrH family)
MAEKQWCFFRYISASLLICNNGIIIAIDNHTYSASLILEGTQRYGILESQKRYRRITTEIATT